MISSSASPASPISSKSAVFSSDGVSGASVTSSAVSSDASLTATCDSSTTASAFSNGLSPPLKLASGPS